MVLLAYDLCLFYKFDTTDKDKCYHMYTLDFKIHNHIFGIKTYRIVNTSMQFITYFDGIK